MASKANSRAAHSASLAVAGHVDRVALVFETPLDEGGHLGLVFDDEHPHGQQSRLRDHSAAAQCSHLGGFVGQQLLDPGPQFGHG